MKKIVVLNLIDKDYRETVIDVIEQTMADAIKKISRIKTPRLYPPNQDTTISFPKDPSVLSPDDPNQSGIPISIEVQLLEEGTQIRASDVKNLANILQQKILSLILFEKRTVWVDVKAFDNGKPVRVGIAQ